MLPIKIEHKKEVYSWYMPENNVMSSQKVFLRREPL